jgi:pimeloyl-ACP methyl ester carboxylesterase
MSQTKPVIVIVPGGFCSPEVYQPVADILEQDGFTVTIPRLTVTKNLTSKDPASPEFKDLANKGLLDDVKEIHDRLASEFDKGSGVVIFGHSYGSLPALLAIEGHTIEERKAKGLSGGIKGYVAVAGFAYAQRGRNARGDTEPAPPMSYFEYEVCQSLTLQIPSLMLLATGWSLPHARRRKASLLQ